MKRKLSVIVAVASIVCALVFCNGSVFAGGVESVNEGSCTSILPNSWCTGGNGITNIITMVITIMTGAVVVAGTVGIIICGFTWMTARENEAQVAKAKQRMLDIVIGLVVWVLLALLANLFIPKTSDDIEEDTPGIGMSLQTIGQNINEMRSI